MTQEATPGIPDVTERHPSSYEGRPSLTEETARSSTVEVRAQLSATEALVDVAQELSMARDLPAILSIVRKAARDLTGADGATFILAEGDQCFYAEEEAISPLWKGNRFPMRSCISGWSMLNRSAAVIEDIYEDARIPHDAYRPTFVKSLAMVPIRTKAPVGAIGNYWARRHRATEGEVKLLQALADLTSVALENVQLYEALQRRIREAEEAVKAREEFITIAAHELRTPLTAVQLQLQALEARPDSGRREDVSKQVSRAVQGTKRLAALVDSLLDASRVTHGPLVLHAEELDLADVARSVLEHLGRLAEQAGCELRLEASAPVPGRWDRVRLEQILMSLVANAIKYGAGKPVRVRVDGDGDRARVAVCDRGVGIAPDIAAKIFERFGRVGPVSHYAGLGLGLYLARAIVEAHGGAIRFESQPNDGCTFIVELPLQLPLSE